MPAAQRRSGGEGPPRVWRPPPTAANHRSRRCPPLPGRNRQRPRSSRRIICRPPVILRLHRERRAPAVSPSPAGSTAPLRIWPDMVRLVSVPQHAVDRATDHPAGGHRWRCQTPRTIWTSTRPGITAPIAALLGMANVLPDPSHGLRYHCQRPRIPRSDCRDAR